MYVRLMLRSHGFGQNKFWTAQQNKTHDDTACCHGDVLLGWTSIKHIRCNYFVFGSPCPSVFYLGSCACRRSWKLGQQKLLFPTVNAAPSNASSVVSHLILWLRRHSMSQRLKEWGAENRLRGIQSCSAGQSDSTTDGFLKQSSYS